jgi:hypothetical protein
MGCCSMVTQVQYHSTPVYRNNGTDMRSMKPDPYDAEAVRAAVVRALEFREETPYSASVGADVADKTLPNFLLPEGHKNRTDTLRLDSAVRIAAYLRLTVSQLIGETPLVTPATVASLSIGSLSAYEDVLALQAQRIAELKSALADALSSRRSGE